MEGRTDYVARARLFSLGQGKKAGLTEKQVLQDKTKSILSELNNNFRNNYHTTFKKQVYHKSIKSTRSSMMLVTSIDTSPCNIHQMHYHKGPMEATIILVSAQHSSTLISQMIQVASLSLITLLPTMPRNTPTQHRLLYLKEMKVKISFIPNLPGGKSSTSQVFKIIS